MLGDVLGSSGRFSMERPAEAAAEYQKARAIAEHLVQADPDNQIAKLDLARTFSREALAVSDTEPERALTLFERFQRILAQSSADGASMNEARLTYLTGTIVPLARSGNFERARTHVSQARNLVAVMENAGLKPQANSVLRAEAILLYESGQTKSALSRAQEHLALLPRNTNAVLSANYEKTKLLERIRTWSARLDSEACVSATEQLVRTWTELEFTYPTSAFVHEHATSARAFNAASCASAQSRR
jgi:hypothetical protein